MPDAAITKLTDAVMRGAINNNIRCSRRLQPLLEFNWDVYTDFGEANGTHEFYELRLAHLID